MRSVSNVEKIGTAILINFNDGEFAKFYPFGETIYTTTSPGVLKHTLSELKKDIKCTSFNEKIIKELWVEK